MLVFCCLTISFVTVTLDIFGRVDNTERTIDATLNMIRVSVGITKNILDGLSSLGIKLDNATEIMMALIESKILAFVSAIALSSV